MAAIFLLLVIGAIYFFIINPRKLQDKRAKDVINDKPIFPPEWRIILAEKVTFYNTLSRKEKMRFENEMLEFLDSCRITGIGVEVEPIDEILIAASAVIPIFAFPDWSYQNLYEILLYPNAFNEKFETSGPDRNILGMVGNGYLKGKMILSKPALHQGFSNESDKRNTAIHEFVHLIDGADGAIDGIPKHLMDKQYLIPWLDLINQQIEAIYAEKSDINPYGGTNRQEFFAVACEYFFERPKLLERKHPLLYQLLAQIFKHDMKMRNMHKKRLTIGRNSPCPCESGLKFKKCCGMKHYQ
ncbi:MAG: zinc-dependent peptidase [Flavobacteriales bacterium]|nr:zinc-dependent peptidase [Flavobacteriales bacterium]